MLSPFRDIVTFAVTIFVLSVITCAALDVVRTWHRPHRG